MVGNLIAWTRTRQILMFQRPLSKDKNRNGSYRRSGPETAISDTEAVPGTTVTVQSVSKERCMQRWKPQRPIYDRPIWWDL